jgi:S1-C subfamily serine protease
VSALLLFAAAVAASATTGPLFAAEVGPTNGEILASVVSIQVTAVANARGDQGRERQGTGVVVERGGYILTSAFLVQEADSIAVTTGDGRTVPAVVAAQDDAIGVAILRPAAPLGVRPLPLGAAATLGPQAPVLVAIAARGRSVTHAQVVAVREYAGHWEYLIEGAILTAPAVRDWAGAALVDGSGKLLGIGSLLLANGNLFIPVQSFQPALTHLARADDGRPPRRAWLGLITAKNGSPLTVTEVLPGSPAERAGVRVGDVIAAVNGEPVRTHAELYRRIWRHCEPGTEVRVTILRDGDPRELWLRAIDPQDYLIQRAAL